jgi:glycosyltransferase 2 family protein
MAYLRILVGLAISIGCVAALLTQIDLERTWQALTRAHLGWLVLAIVLLLITMEAKAYRWGILYYPTRGLRLRNLTAALYIGYMLNSLLPARVGELARAYLIGKTEPVTFSQSVGTVLVEKVLDVVTILLFLVGLGLFGLLPALAVPGWVLAAMGFGGLAFLFAMAWIPQKTIFRIVARAQLLLPLPRRFNLVSLLGPFLDALAVLRHGRLLPALAGWSLFNWGMSAIVNYVAMQAFDLQAPFAAAIFLMVVTNLGMIVPSAPGYVGVFHGLAWVALAPYGVDPNTAAAYAAVLHAAVYGTFIVLGLWFAWRGGYRFADLWPGRRAAATAPVGDEPPPPAPLRAPVVAATSDRPARR